MCHNLPKIATFTIFVILLANYQSIYAQKSLENENPFYSYLSHRFQEKKIPEVLSKKVWNYLSNPSKGYKNAGLTSDEFALLVKEYAESLYSKKIIESYLEAIKIDTRESISEDKKAENITKYIKHIERLAEDFGFYVLNLQNRYLVVYMDGEQPPLGISGKIKVSSNYLEVEEPIYRDGIVIASPAISSKLAIELAIFSAGVLNKMGLKNLNRVIFYIDLSLSMQTNVDILFNSYELAPINLVLDSVFPLSCAEYGYAYIRIVQHISNIGKKSKIRYVLSDGGEYLIPNNSIICFELDKIDYTILKERISKFSQKYSKIEIKDDVSHCIKFSIPANVQASKSNALDYIVLFITENRDLFSESINLFEYLRRNIVMNISGKSLGINRYHSLLKNTEVILKSIGINGNSIFADVYIRFPYGIESTFLVEKIKRSVDIFNKKEASDIEVYINAYNPIVIDANSDVAKKVRRAYASIIGGNERCVIADGIYSKLLPNSIGFGPYFPDNYAPTKISTTDILKIFNVYLTALIYLMEK